MTTASQRLRYAFLGPEGTFTEAALLQVDGVESADLLPASSVDAALESVRAGAVTAAMVPIENSVEGGVNATLDALASGEPLHVIGEYVVPVTFDLVAAPGAKPGSLAGIGVVSSHPHGLAQCRGWLHHHLPDTRIVPALSTAGAATGLLEPNPGYDAALCAPIAGRRLGLPVLATNVGDNPSAATRFVLVARPGRLPAPTGADKTTLVAYLAHDHPGALMELLEQFAVRGVNLTRLESRPTGESLGLYCMSIDAEGHVHDARLAEALKGLHRVCRDVRFLGSYPRADGQAASVTPDTSDKAFTAAEAWLRDVQGH